MTTPASPASPTWTAEDIPAFQFDGSTRRPRSDFDAAMSAPRVLIKETTEDQARRELVIHLVKSRSYAERYNRGSMYDTAIDYIEAGANFVQVEGRGYRLRDAVECDSVGDAVMPHAIYQHCPQCLPERYLSITEAVRLPHTPHTTRPFPTQRTTTNKES